jgi:spermidine synthase
VQSVTLVDLDPEVTSLFARTPFLSTLNDGALKSEKVHVINADAFVWLQGAHEHYDAVIVDFPDPSNYSIGKLFTLTFYRRLASVLAPDGWAVIQSTSPYVARQAFWCVEHTVQAAGLVPRPTMSSCLPLANGVSCWPAMLLYACRTQLPCGTALPDTRGHAANV